MDRRRSRPDAMCPIRIGDACSLCVPGATGPQDCSLVRLVMSDPDLREELARLRRELAGPDVRPPAGRQR